MSTRQNFWKSLFFLLVIAILPSGTVISQNALVQVGITKGIDAWYDRKDHTGDLFFRDVYDFDYGDPTPAEQAHLEAINRARANPMAEAARLGINLFEGVLSGAISGLPVQPLVMNANLLTAARLHSRDMVDNNYFAHSSLDGKTPFDRMGDAGYSYSHAGENLAFMGSTGLLDEEETALALHDNLFIDEDSPNRGHRVNILQDDFKEVGAGLAAGAYRELTNSYMLTCDFGTPFRYAGSFVLGVVYDDVNGNDFYNIGEGIANVGITVSGVGSTVTAVAGGYGIPVTPGDYTVTATLPDGRTALKTRTIYSENEKIDFLRSEFTPSGSDTPAPTADTVPTKPVLSVSVSGTTVNISWSADNTDTYILYAAPYPDASVIYDFDMGNQTSISFDLPEGSAFYLAVRASNSAGLSDWSNIEYFDLSTPPASSCGAYIAPGVWKEFDCYNLAAIGKTTGADPFTPSWELIGGYWQWGRKGPGSNQWHDTNTEHFAHGPTGPGSSLANNGSISNWDDDYAPDGAWSDTSKTVNDPCPDGFRVPTRTQWEGVVDNNTQSTFGSWEYDDTNYSSARFFGSDLMLPAAGSRDYGGSGALYYRGNFGDYWSSSELGSDTAWGLVFYSGNADANGNFYRRYGRSVRCVAE